jgi:hypothetical protein
MCNLTMGNNAFNIEVWLPRRSYLDGPDSKIAVAIARARSKRAGDGVLMDVSASLKNLKTKENLAE